MDNGKKEQGKIIFSIITGKKQEGEKKMELNIKIILTIIGMIVVTISLLTLNIPSVDGFTFDNVKTYDTAKKEIVIKNMFGLGSSLVEYKLEKNTDQCLVDCYSIGTIKLNVKGKIYSDIEFMDKKMEPKSISSKFYIEDTREETKERQVDDCKIELEKNTKNNSYKNTCNKPAIEKYTENVKYWKEYNGETLDIGVYRWKIEGKKGLKEDIDWIITTGGDEIGNYRLDEWTWWSSSWVKKQELIINELSGKDLYNFTISFNVTYATGMNTDFSDLRFTNTAETTELGYWIEIKEDSKYAYVWVMVNEKITASANTSIFMYYGNVGASTTSNISQAFLFGDDFNDGSIDTNRWNQTVGAGVVWTEDNGAMNGTGGAGTLSYLSSPFKISNATIEYKASPVHTTKWMGVAGRIAIVDEYEDLYLFSSGYGSKKMGIGKDWGDGIANNVASVSYFNLGKYYRFYAKMNGPTLNFTLFEDGSSIQGNDTTYQDGHVALYHFSPVSFDWFGVRNVTKYEPVIYFGDISTSDQPPTATLNNTPINYYNSSSSLLTLNCSGTDNNGVMNLSLLINGAVNYTIQNSSSNQNLSLQITRNFNDGFYGWNCTAVDTASVLGISANKFFNIDTKFPQIRTLYPPNGTIISTFSLPVLVSFNFSLVETTPSTCTLFNGANNLSTNCFTNKSVSFADQGNYKFGLYVNDSTGRYNSTETSFHLYYINVTDTASHTSIGEGENVIYILYVNRTSIPVTTAYFVFNGTLYYPDAINSLPDSYKFTKTFNVPDGYGNSTGKPYNTLWNYSITGITAINQSTTTRSLVVYNVSIDDCTLYSNVILTMYLKDENDNFVINYSTINDTNIQLDLLLHSISNESLIWTYSNTWINDSDGMIQVCVPGSLLNNTNYSIDITASYLTNGYVEEFFHLDNGIVGIHDYFNSYTNNSISLYDLVTGDSTTFLFTFLDANGGTIPNVIVHVFRRYIGEGIYREVERAREDDNGETHVHLVEEDVIYYFMVTQLGNIIYTSSNYHAKCLSSPCAVSFSLGTTNVNWDVINIDDKNYVIRTNKTSRMVYLDFTGNSSRTVNLSLMRFYYGVEEYLNSTSTYAQSGTLSMLIPNSYGNQTFMVRIFSDGMHVRTELLDMKSLGRFYFGGMGAFLGGIMLVTLVLISASEGLLVLIVVPIGLVIMSIMSLVDLTWLAIISLICYAVIIMMKIVNRKRKGFG
jgi:hypothetical protein